MESLKMSARDSKTWIPVDVKIHWFSFLSAVDLARASRVCRSWVSLIQKTADASIVELTCATPPPLGRGSKLKFYHRLQNATSPEHMGYLLAWAAGCREYTPFLHKLLLLRDTVREDFGLPGGLHEVARPEAFAQTDEDVRALFTYKGGAAGAEAGHQHPLVVAASRGNVDAVHLLLLFGEGVHSSSRVQASMTTAPNAAGPQAAGQATAGSATKRGPYERALYVAVEQGNAAVVAALLGRVPLRPPRHPAHAAAKLGLFRPVWDVRGPGGVYSSGVTLGPRDVPAAIAGTRVRAELAAATGFTTAAGQVKASASAAMTAGKPGGPGSVGVGPVMGHVEASVAQLQLFEADGRYRAWCRGYRMGTYWATYDTALANWEALHGPMGAAIGSDMCVPGSVLPPPPSALRSGGGGAGKGAKALPKVRVGDLIRTTLYNLKARLDCNIAPGTSAHGSVEGCTAPFAAQALLVSRLQPTAPLALLSRPAARVNTRFGGEDGYTPGVTAALPARVPAPLDYGLIAAEALAVKVRLNAGPGEGRTPLWAACDLGRVEIAYLLLSHHAPALAAAALVPELPSKEEEGEGAGAAPGAPPAAAAAAPGGAPAQPAVPANATVPVAPVAALPLGAAAAAAPAAPTAPAAPDPAVLAEARAREELSALASMTVPALAVPPDLLYCAPSSASSVDGGLYVAQPLLSGAGSEDRAHVLPQGKLGGLPEAGLVACPAPPQAAARREEVLSELMGERRDRVDVEACPPGQHSPLGLACERGSALLVQLLLHWGADVNRPGRKDAPPVLTASMAHHEQVLRVLLRAACSPEPAKEVAAVVDRLRADRGQAPLGMGMGMGTGLRRSASADSDAEGEGTSSGRAAPPGLFPLLGMSSAPAALRALANHGKSSALLRTVLAASGCAALRRVLTEGFRLDRDADKGTAASNAMGSTVARQRGGKKGGGTGPGGREGSEGRPEDPTLDLCEPSVVAALAAAAAAANNAVDEYGTPLPARPAPVDMTLFLPSDEAAAASGEGLGGPSALAYYKTGAVGTRTKLGGGAGGGRLAALLAQHRAQVSSITVLGAAALSSSSSGRAGGEGEGEEAGLAPEDILTHPTSTSYIDLVACCELFKQSVRAACQSLSACSRACAGVGSLAGRPVLDVNIGDESGYTPLFIMASAGKLETVMLLIAAGADPTLPTKRGKTAIYGAVEKSHEEVVEFLMTRYSAAQLRANTTYGTNVLHAATKAGSSKIASMLTAYCVEYDGRMQKAMRADAAARRKAQWGEGEEGAGGDSDGELAVGGQAAEHLRKLRAAAEAAKKREAEAAASRRMGVRGASVGPRLGGRAESEGDEDAGAGTDSELEKPSVTATRKAEAVYGSSSSALRSRSTSRAPQAQHTHTPSKSRRASEAKEGEEGVTGRPTLPLGQATVKLSPYSSPVSPGKGGKAAAGKPPKPAAGKAGATGRGRSLGPALEAAGRRATISRGSSVASDDSLTLQGVSSAPGPVGSSATSPASPPLALPSPSRLAAGGGTGAVRRLSMASTGAPAAAGGVGAGRSPGDSTITGPRSVRSLGGGGAGSASEGGSPHSMQEAQQAGGSVFERLAARAKELEAKRKLQEEELLGSSSKSKGGGGTGSSTHTSSSPRPLVVGAALLQGGSVGSDAASAPAGSKKAAPGPVVPKPGSKPAYLLEYERAKAAEREGKGPAAGGGGEYEPGTYGQAAKGSKAAASNVPLSAHPRLAATSAGTATGRASTAASHPSSAGGGSVDSLDLTPLLAAAAAAAPSVVAGAGKSTAPGLPKSTAGKVTAPASNSTSTGGVGVGGGKAATQGDSGSRASSADSARAGTPTTATQVPAVQDKAATERAKRQAFLDRLTSVTVPLPGAAPVSLPAPPAASVAPSEGKAPAPAAPKVNPLVAAASSSFEAAAASFAAKKAELDSMLAQLDAAESAAAASVGAGKGGGKILSPNKAGKAAPTSNALPESPIAQSPIFLRPRSGGASAAATQQQEQTAADTGAASGRSSPASAVHSKATLLGMGLGLPSGTPTKSSSMSDAGSSSSPLQGVLTRGLGLGLGMGQDKGTRGKQAASKEAASASAPSSPSKPAVDPAEVAAREERNRQREAARIARLEQARAAAEAKRREEEEMAYKGAAAAGPGAAGLTSLKLAVSAYGGSLVPKKKR